MPRTGDARQREQSFAVVGTQLERGLQGLFGQRIARFVAMILRLAHELVGEVNVIQGDFGMSLDPRLIETNRTFDRRRG